MKRRSVLALAVAVTLVVAAGVAYASIPGSGGVYNACMLNGIGTIRLIDPSLPSSNLMSHCLGPKLETPIQWNQQGQKGDPGAPGAAGPAGKNGASPTVAQLAAGDSHCPNGGAAITDANGSTAYVCNGQNGTNGTPFNGTFTSENGQFSLTVADNGVQITGNGSTISLTSTGDVNIATNGNLSISSNNQHDVVQNDRTTFVAHDDNVSVDHDQTISVGHNRTQTVANGETVTIHGDRSETVDGNETIRIGGNRSHTVGGDDSVTIAGNRSESVGKSENVEIGSDRSVQVGGGDTITIGGSSAETIGHGFDVEASGGVTILGNGQLDLRGSLVQINDGPTCQPVARVGDTVTVGGSVGTIVTGSATVCIGG
jgi:Bacteriophage T4 gp5 C-terminal trimerisation domain